MTFAEQQYRAHIERQRRLGKTVVQPVRPINIVAPSLAPQTEPVISPAQAKMIEALQDEVAQLSARLKAMVREDQSPLVVPSRIKPVISAVAKFYRVAIGDLISFRRTHELIRPRQVAMYLAKELTRHSLPTIGRVMERDHTTVLHGCRRIARLRQEDPLLDAEIRMLIERLTPTSPCPPEDRQTIPGLPGDRREGDMNHG
jgi:DnaA-like protein